MNKNKKHFRRNSSLEGNSSKKLLPISTIEITPQYAIVLSPYSWNPLVFLWGKRDYLAGNTALMWRRGREKIKRFNGSGFLSLNFDDVHNALKSLSYLSLLYRYF